MSKQPGYPLPSGELGSDDIVCQLVYLPDRPEYWQAFYAALHYMTTWRAWERDDDKRGKDAAANWRAAFELTSECWRMTCLEQLQDDVAEILAIMQLGNSCCDEQDITDGDRYTDRVEDGEGNVPQNIIDAGYADDAADWEGFNDYKCMISHVAVNQIEARLREIDEVVESAGPYLAVAAALSAILGVIVATGGLAIVFGILAGIGTVSALYYALIEFGPVGDLADEVATNHDALACAIYFSDGDADALIDLNDKIDELFTVPEALILKNLNLSPTLKALYAGRYDQQDIADELLTAGYDLEDFDCTCIEELGEVHFDTYWELRFTGDRAWEESGLEWTGTNIAWATDIWYTKSNVALGVSDHVIRTNRFEGFIGAEAGAHDDIWLTTMRVYLRHWGTGEASLTFTVYYDDTSIDQTVIPYTIGTDYQWISINVDPTKKVLKTESTTVLKFATPATGTPQNQYYVQRLEIVGSYTVL